MPVPVGCRRFLLGADCLVSADARSGHRLTGPAAILPFSEPRKTTKLGLKSEGTAQTRTLVFRLNGASNFSRPTQNGPFIGYIAIRSLRMPNGSCSGLLRKRATSNHSDSLDTLLYARFYHSEPRVL